MKKLMAFLLTAVMACSMGTTAFAATATPSSDKVTRNGHEMKAQVYNIDGYNYFKLRDVAKMLVGLPDEFSVDYDAGAQLIVINTGWGYEGPTEFDKVVSTGVKTANPGNGDVMVNGKIHHLSAYNIDGYNYFKLRDLGSAVGFQVGWDAEQKCVNIISSYAPPEEMMQDVPGYGMPEDDLPDNLGKATVVEDSFYVEVNESVGYWYDNYVFFGDEVFVCWVYGGDGGRVKFTNCEFNCDLIVAGAMDDNWVTLENCTFAPGYGRYFAE